MAAIVSRQGCWRSILPKVSKVANGCMSSWIIPNGSMSPCWRAAFVMTHAARQHGDMLPFGMIQADMQPFATLLTFGKMLRQQPCRDTMAAIPFYSCADDCRHLL